MMNVNLSTHLRNNVKKTTVNYLEKEIPVRKLLLNKPQMSKSNLALKTNAAKFSTVTQMNSDHLE